jgi:hypothetical protein
MGVSRFLGRFGPKNPSTQGGLFGCCISGSGFGLAEGGAKLRRPERPEMALWARLPPPDALQAIRLRDSTRLQQAYNPLALSACKQKRPRRIVFNHLILLRKSGAGEGIRTLDPNLGKVVLYP